MEKYIKSFLENIHNKSTREILENHMINISISDYNKIEIIIDKKYAFNELNSSEHIGNLISGVKKTFGDDSETIIKLQSHLLRDENVEHHDREENIPHIIHYK